MTTKAAIIHDSCCVYRGYAIIAVKNIALSVPSISAGRMTTLVSSLTLPLSLVVVLPLRFSRIAPM